MNFKTTIVLLILLLLVGGFLIWDKDHPAVSPDAPANPQNLSLFEPAQWPKDHIASVKFEIGNQSVLLTQSGKDWVQTQPVRFKLNRWSAQKLPDAAGDLKYTEKFTAGQKGAPSLKQLQLAPAKATVTVTFSDKHAPQVLRLGRLAVGGRAYLMLNDSPTVYVVNDDLHKLVFNEKVSDWRSRSLAGPTEGEASKITKTDAHGTITLVKSNGNWVFAAPHAGRADRQAATDLIGAVNNIYIGKFIADNPADLSIYGLNHPTVKLTITQPTPGSTPGSTPTTKPAQTKNKAASPKVHTLLIGSAVDLKQENFFATWASGNQAGTCVFTITKADREKFDKTVNDLRDPKLSPLEASDVTDLSIRITQKPAPLHLARSAEGWRFSDPKPAFSIDQKQAKQLLDTILTCEASGYITHPKPAKNALLATVRLTATGKAEPDVLKVYRQSDTRYLVLRNNETVGYQVASSKLTALFDSALALRNRRIAHLQPDRVNKLVLTLPDRTVLTFTRKVTPLPVGASSQPAASQPTPEAGPWQLQGHSSFEAGALDDLLQAASTLSADKWLSTAAPKTAANPYHLSLQTAEGKKIDLQIDGVSRSARAQGITGVFVVSQSFMDKLTAELRNRTLLDLLKSDIQQVEIQTGKQPKIVVTQDQNGELAAKDGRKLDDAATGQLFDTLAGLRVKQYTKPKLFAVTTTIRIKTQNAQYLLELGSQYGRLGKTHFKLSREDLKKLTASLTP